MVMTHTHTESQRQRSVNFFKNIGKTDAQMDTTDCSTFPANVLGEK